MKGRSILTTVALCAVIFFCFCRKKDKKRLPVVTTTEASAGGTVARCGGVVYSAGDAEITENGICWGTSQNITVDDNTLICDLGDSFSGEIKGLEQEKKYYARAYAINKYGVGYGDVVSITTWGANYPTVLLAIQEGPSANEITLALQVNQSKPSSFITGICWSANPTPVVTSQSVMIVQRNYTDSLLGYKFYNHTIANLEESVKYYARAFTTSSLGTVYSNEISWTTPNPVDHAIASVLHTEASCNVFVSGIEASLVKAVGLCWGQNPLPTIADSKIEKPYSAGTINFNIQSLQSNTTYYVRSYIVVGSKTIYGPNERMMRTLKGTVTDVNGNIYNTVEINGQEWTTSNYRASSFNNGTAIPVALSYNHWVNSVNSKTPIYCYYNDNSSNNIPYGKLYPKYVASDANFAPTGWRLPTAADWQTLLSSAGALNLCIINGTWQDPGITNPYGFSVYAAGVWDSGYQRMNTESRFWAATVTTNISEDNTCTFSNYNQATVTWSQSGDGQSVRFIKQ